MEFNKTQYKWIVRSVAFVVEMQFEAENSTYFRGLTKIEIVCDYERSNQRGKLLSCDLS
jgi:hypothetical protein